jgi:hypothetical protein
LTEGSGRSYTSITIGYAVAVTWRVVLRLYGGGVRVVDVPGVAELRDAVEHARRDPDVTGWRYWRMTELGGRVRSACPRCRARYEPGTVTGRVCRCGLVHVAHECRGCRTDLVDPPYAAGCGEVPFDAEGVNARYRRRRWRRSG